MATDPVNGTAVHTFTHNLLSQLTGDSQTGGTGATNKVWGYDSVNRLTTRTDSTANTSATFTTDAADQLTTLLTKTGTLTTQNLTLTYNRDGDRLTNVDSISGASLGYGYDQADRLTSYSSGGVTQATYAYDGDGLRQSTTVGGTTTAYTWDQWGGLPLLLQAGTTSYIAGPDGHPIEQIDGSGNPSYYLYDQLGNVEGLVNQAGTITDSYTYDVYGKRTAITGSVGDTPFGFAGEYTDAETGFQYLQARYYDPATGQFLTADPAFALTGQRYAYAGGDPLTWTDPSGLCLIRDFWGHCIVPDATDIGNAAHGTVSALSATVNNARNAEAAFRQNLVDTNNQMTQALGDTLGQLGNKTVSCLNFANEASCQQAWHEYVVYAQLDAQFQVGLHQQQFIDALGATYGPIINDLQCGQFAAAVGKLAPRVALALFLAGLGGAGDLSTVDETVPAADLAAGTGRLGGQLYPASRLLVLERYLARHNVTLRVGDEYLPSKVYGAYNYRTRELLLGDNPTTYEVQHELSHYIQHRNLGDQAFGALTRVQKEQYVFDMLENNKNRWGALTYEQQVHAAWYILRIGGLP